MILKQPFFPPGSYHIGHFFLFLVNRLLLFGTPFKQIFYLIQLHAICVYGGIQFIFLNNRAPVDLSSVFHVLLCKIVVHILDSIVIIELYQLPDDCSFCLHKLHIGTNTTGVVLHLACCKVLCISQCHVIGTCGLAKIASYLFHVLLCHVFLKTFHYFLVVGIFLQLANQNSQCFGLHFLCQFCTDVVYRLFIKCSFFVCLNILHGSLDDIIAFYDLL